MEKNTFKNCTLPFLEDTFGLVPVNKMVALDEWISPYSYDVEDRERYFLNDLKDRLAHKVEDWNEQELSISFIGPLLHIVKIGGDKYNGFMGRDFGGIVANIELVGKPDAMIASGRHIPVKPYFFFQEYKKESDPDGDPRAQALAAMLVAQTLNEDGLPIYGGYVRGRNWFFMALQGKKYAKSLAFDATQDDIFQIFAILKKLKTLIEARLPKDEDEE